MTERVVPDSETPRPNLIVEFVVPHYFLSLLDLDDGICGEVTFVNEEDNLETIGGAIYGVQNNAGDWLLNIHDPITNEILFGTFIDNIRKIVVA